MTGTNGKTTTAFLVRHMLERAGIQTGLLGTIWSVVGGRREEVVRTTPEAVDLQRTFREMLDAGDAACVLEVSSHALELHRADAIDFDCAIFTNLTQDHLDFHGTLEDYFGAKRRLFVPQTSSPPSVPVVNLDDELGRTDRRGAGRVRSRRAHHLRDRAGRRSACARRALRRVRRRIHADRRGTTRWR